MAADGDGEVDGSPAVPEPLVGVGRVGLQKRPEPGHVIQSRRGEHVDLDAALDEGFHQHPADLPHAFAGVPLQLLRPCLHQRAAPLVPALEESGIRVHQRDHTIGQPGADEHPGRRRRSVLHEQVDPVRAPVVRRLQQGRRALIAGHIGARLQQQPHLLRTALPGGDDDRRAVVGVDIVADGIGIGAVLQEEADNLQAPGRLATRIEETVGRQVEGRRGLLRQGLAQLRLEGPAAEIHRLVADAGLGQGGVGLQTGAQGVQVEIPHGGEPGGPLGVGEGRIRVPHGASFRNLHPNRASCIAVLPAGVSIEVSAPRTIRISAASTWPV